METKFRCSGCSSKLSAAADLGGMTVNCPHCNLQVRVPQPSLAPGTELGNFRIDHLLGTGNMGEVFLATQVSMDRPVALKVLSRDLLEDEESIHFFHNEIRSLARLDHPNIVGAFEAGQKDGCHYLAMTYVDGESLAERVDRDGPLNEHDALMHVMKVARALDYAWSRFQMMHRDVKPANIMIDADGDVKLMDLGLAKYGNAEDREDSAYAYGTPDYMSPEQIRAQPDIDFRADIYSLGATLYDLLTGEPPYGEGEPAAVVRMHLREPVPSVRDVNPDISEPTDLLIQRMMRKDPVDRFASWEDVISEFRRCLKNLDANRSSSSRRSKRKVITNVPSPGTYPPPAARRQKSSVGAWILAALIMLGVLGAGGFLAYTIYRDAQNLVPIKPPLEVKTPVTPAVTDTTAAVVQPIDDGDAQYEAMLERRLREAMSLEANAPENFDAVITAYEHVIELGPSSDQAQQAETAVARLRAARQAAADAVLAALAAQVADDVTAERYDRAARVYRDYDGPQAELTADERRRIAADLQRKAMQKARAEQEARSAAEAQRQAAEAKLASILDVMVEFIWQNRWDRVVPAVETARQDAELALVRQEAVRAFDDLSVAAAYPRRVLTNLARQPRGETISLRLKTEKVKLRLDAVGADGVIRAKKEVASGGTVGLIGMSFRWNELHYTELLDRQADPGAKAGTDIARFAILLEAGQEQEAERVMATIDGPVGAALKRKWDALHAPAPIFNEDPAAEEPSTLDGGTAAAIPALRDGLPRDGLKVWYHGMAGIELTDGRVSTWRNLAGDHFHATQAHGASRPAPADTRNWNGMGGIEMRELRQGLSVDGAYIDGEKAITLFLLFSNNKRRDLNDQDRVMGLESNDLMNFFRVDFWGKLATQTGRPTVTLGTGFRPANQATGQVFSVTGPAVAEARGPLLLTLRAQPGEIVLRQNGEAGESERSPWPGDGRIHARGIHFIGASGNDSNPVGTFNGAIHEVIVYNRALSDAQVEEIEKLLAQTYRLRLHD